MFVLRWVDVPPDAASASSGDDSESISLISSDLLFLVTFDMACLCVDDISEWSALSSASRLELPSGTDFVLSTRGALRDVEGDP